MKKQLIIFTDIGDTIIDEGSEIRTEPGGIVWEASCIPGAQDTYLTLFGKGYRIAMVADGLVRSFQNTMEQNGLEHIFEYKAISEAVGAEKPSRIMFENAMAGMGLTDEDKGRIIMVDNNLARDVAGANRFGIRSVLMDWSERYNMVPSCEEQEPTYRIHSPEELVDLAERLEKKLEKR